ncbi:lipid A deacylase LpxR family protein [Poseidonibacter lekithochrous]|uniref:lipid A deacylase LpxR family protein n=1 Tax=Poseidonibacter lekithochrous TaxID=1904463 RepID=UPI0008FCA408|nr:lipid A deacylase LpxR family protein [Poseidonibacter lekithochrous]QKJ23695.1 DUF2219 domain-containing protein [Poseidonibacter lekithochrous]
MKIFLKIIAFTILTTNLFSQSLSLYLENDFIGGYDKHYTNGFAIAYVNNTNDEDVKITNNKLYDFLYKVPTFYGDMKYSNSGLVFSHLTFTPHDISKKEKITNDLPYAGVATFDFFVQKWNEKILHQYMLTLGLVGPSTYAKQLQKEMHSIFGNNDPKGWDNQLKDDFIYNAAYSLSTKPYTKDIGSKKFDITNTYKIDLGNYYRAIQVGSKIRISKNFANNFNTIGRLIGINENLITNYASFKNKKFAWALSYGLSYSYIDYFYINDYDKSYNNQKIKNVFTHIISAETIWKKYILSVTAKISNTSLNNDHPIKNNWAGLNITYLF